MKNPLDEQTWNNLVNAGLSGDQIVGFLKGDTTSPYQTGNPLTSPSVPFKSLGEKTPGLGLAALEAVPNLPTSIIRNATQLGGALMNVFNPNPQKNTLGNIGKAGAGAIETAASKVTGKPINTEDTQAFEGMKNYFIERYGSWDNFKRTLAEDPAGLAFDIATAVEGGGSALKGLGSVAEKAGAEGAGAAMRGAGESVAKAGRAMNPVSIGSKLLGKSISGPANLANKPFQNSLDTEAASLSGRYGVKLPASSLTENKFVQGLEALQAKGVFGSPVQEVYNNAVAKIQNLSNDLADTIRPMKSLDMPTLGNLIKKGFTEFQDTFHNTKTALYDDFSKHAEQITGKVAGDLPAVVENYREQLQKSADMYGNPVLGGAFHAEETFYRNLLDGVTGEKDLPKGLRGLIGKIKGLPEAGLSFDELKSIRSMVGQKLKSSTDVIATGTKANMESLYAAISDDLDATVQKYGGDELAKKFQDANNFYREGIQKINGLVGSKIENLNPESLVNKFVKPNNVTDLQTLKELTGPEKFKQISNSFITDALEKSMTEQDFLPEKFIQQIKKFDEPTLRVLLDTDQYAHLQDVLKHADELDSLKTMLKRGSAIGAGSQTAFLSAINNAKQALLGGIGTGGFIMGGIGESVLGMAAYILGDYTLSKFIASDIGRKFLTEGLQLQLPQKIGAGIENIGNAGRLTPLLGYPSKNANPLNDYAVQYLKDNGATDDDINALLQGRDNVMQQIKSQSSQ